MFVRFIYIWKDVLLEKEEVSPTLLPPFCRRRTLASLPLLAAPGAVLGGDGSRDKEAAVLTCSPVIPTDAASCHL